MFGPLGDLFSSFYNADSWSDAMLYFAIVSVGATSLVLLYRMLRYKGRNRLDNAIVVRELAWILLAFRFTTSIAWGWDWSSISWLVWLFIALANIGIIFEQNREHRIGDKYGSDVE